tara:strand:+ start:339 stop:1328 length:990 start_codon:yes stop_codon:yes gene_type:complete
MKNYKLVEMVADKIYANKEYGIRYELEKYEDQIKLEYGPQMFRDLQLKVQENREDEVSEWLKTSGFIKSETVEFHEGFVRSQIRKILKETPNSFQGGKPFGRRSDQDYHDAHNTQNEGKGQDLADKYIAQLRQEFKNLNDEELDEFKKTLATAFDMNESRDMPGFEGTMDQLDNLYNKPERSVTKRDWDRADDYQRVTWLLQVIDDSDDAERHAETEWEYLPDEARDFMRIEESAIDKSKKNYADWKKLVNEDAGMDTPGGNPDYFYDTKPKPTSTSRVYVLMLGNRHRGVMGPAMVFADKAAAEAEAAKEEASGNDTKAFVQDLRFIK